MLNEWVCQRPQVPGGKFDVQKFYDPIRYGSTTLKEVLCIIFYIVNYIKYENIAT